MGDLAGKRVLLGVTGGIAAYKMTELVRLLRKAEVEIRVVMTEAGSRFITPLTLQALSGNPVRTTLFDPAHEAAMGHIELARWADLILIAPASADFLARMALGLANDLLSTLVLASDVPIAVAPAMNRQMWANPATRRNIDWLKQQGIHCWGPAEGEQACGETGPGRLLEATDLYRNLAGFFGAGRLRGIRVLLTAGPTREPIDPVRFIGNRSSGKMGFSLAAAFVSAGAEVTLVSGPVSLATPAGVERLDVETAQEMQAAVMARVGCCDIFVGCAAVADYRPEQVVDQKIKKKSHEMSVRLIRNPDILAGVARLDPAPFTVGFAAETQDPVGYARDKLERKRLNMIAANRVGGEEGGFESNRNALSVIWAKGEMDLPMSSKAEIARQLVQIIAEHYEQRD